MTFTIHVVTTKQLWIFSKYFPKSNFHNSINKVILFLIQIVFYILIPLGLKLCSAEIIPSQPVENIVFRSGIFMNLFCH